MAGPESQAVRCPFCGREADEGSFRLLREPWRFRFYTVKRLTCPSCGGVFNRYEGVSPRGKPVAFAIRVRPRVGR